MQKQFCDPKIVKPHTTLNCKIYYKQQKYYNDTIFITRLIITIIVISIIDRDYI